MEEKNKKDINRRDFIKIVGISAATSTGLLYGCSSKGTTSASSVTGEGEVPTDKMTYRTSPTTGDHIPKVKHGHRWLEMCGKSFYRWAPLLLLLRYLQK